MRPAVAGRLATSRITAPRWDERPVGRRLLEGRCDATLTADSRAPIMDRDL
jgi:hypothetical protein